PIEGRLVAIEHNLYFLIGTGRAHAAFGQWPVTTADRGDRAGRAGYRHSASTAAISTAAAATGSAAAATAGTAASGSTSTASHAVVQRGHVDAAAGSRRIGHQ